jgi:thioredoxin 1
MSALHLNSDSFATAIQNTEKPVLVDFWAEWCGPCKMLGPIIDELAVEKGDAAVVAKLDIDASPEIAAQYGVTAIPTIIIFQGGKVLKSLRGVQSKSALSAALAV